jgi:hypothetical protein
MAQDLKIITLNNENRIGPNNFELMLFSRSVPGWFNRFLFWVFTFLSNLPLVVNLFISYRDLICHIFCLTHHNMPNWHLLLLSPLCCITACRRNKFSVINCVVLYHYYQQILIFLKPLYNNYSRSYYCETFTPGSFDFKWVGYKNSKHLCPKTLYRNWMVSHRYYTCSMILI